MSDVRDLLRWVQEQCEPYPQRGRPDGDPPQNFTSDMQDGMALACVLHAHFTDLIDVDEMVPGAENALENNQRVLAALGKVTRNLPWRVAYGCTKTESL